MKTAVNVRTSMEFVTACRAGPVNIARRRARIQRGATIASTNASASTTRAAVNLMEVASAIPVLWEQNARNFARKVFTGRTASKFASAVENRTLFAIQRTDVSVNQDTEAATATSQHSVNLQAKMVSFLFCFSTFLLTFSGKKEFGNKKNASTAVTLPVVVTTPTSVISQTAPIEVPSQIESESRVEILTETSTLKPSTTDEIFTFHPIGTTTQMVHEASKTSSSVFHKDSSTNSPLITDTTLGLNSENSGNPGILTTENSMSLTTENLMILTTSNSTTLSQENFDLKSEVFTSNLNPNLQTFTSTLVPNSQSSGTTLNSEAKTNSFATISTTTEEPFTFHPIGTTTKLSDPNQNVPSTFGNLLTSTESLMTSTKSFETTTNLPTKSFSKTVTIDVDSQSTNTEPSSLNPSLSTDFYSENPKNILRVTTEKADSTLKFLPVDDDLNDPVIVTTESLIDLNEIVDETKEYEHKKGTTVENNEDEMENEQKDETGNQMITEESGFDHEVSSLKSDLVPTSTKANLVSKIEGTSETSTTLITENSVTSVTELSTHQTFETFTKIADEKTDLTSTETSVTSSQNVDFDSTVDGELLYDRNGSEVSNTTRKPKFKNFFYYYFIASMKANESRAKETNLTDEVAGSQAMFMGIPGEQSCVLHLKSNSLPVLFEFFVPLALSVMQIPFETSFSLFSTNVFFFLLIR